MLRFLRSGNKRTKLIWWFLTIITVLSFAFLFGTGIDQSAGLRRSGAVGSVNGHSISQADYQTALEDQRATYRRQYGADPTDRDARMVELQAWRGLIAQRLIGRLASAEGMTVYDPEVSWSLKTSPPTALATNAAFQTDGKFDPNKYQQALRNPANTWWGPFEDMVREQLPTRKLEQHLLSAIKLSQPELQDEFRYRYEHLDAKVVQVPPSNDPAVPAPGAADLQRAYDTNKGRFVSGLRVQLEVLMTPHKYADEDTRTAKQLAQSLVDRARHGEDFAQLAKDYSEGPAANTGGVISRVIPLPEFGVMSEHVATLKAGEVSDALPDNGRFLIFKVIERVPGVAGAPEGMKVAQIVIRTHANEGAQREQYDALVKLRARAARIGLGKAAAEKGLGTMKTRFYDANTPPEELFSAPEVSDWGLRAKPGSVSPVFEGIDEFVIASVAGRHEAGPVSKDELAEPLRQLAAMDLRVDRAKPRADSLAAALAHGATLEQAAQSVGLTPVVAMNMTRSQPDPQLAGTPEVVGALFAAPQGKVVGPIRGFGGWYFARVERRAIADSTTFEKNKGQLSSDLMTRRQQSFFNSFVNRLLASAKVQDLRYEAVR